MGVCAIAKDKTSSRQFLRLEKCVQILRYYYRLCILPLLRFGYCSAARIQLKNVQCKRLHLNVNFDGNFPRDWASSSTSVVKLNQLAIDCQFKCKEHFAWITIDQPSNTQCPMPMHTEQKHTTSHINSNCKRIHLVLRLTLFTQFYSHFYGSCCDFMTNVHSIQWKSNKMTNQKCTHQQHSHTKLCHSEIVQSYNSQRVVIFPELPIVLANRLTQLLNNLHNID